MCGFAMGKGGSSKVIIHIIIITSPCVYQMIAFYNNNTFINITTSHSKYF